MYLIKTATILCFMACQLAHAMEHNKTYPLTLKLDDIFHNSLQNPPYLYYFPIKTILENQEIKIDNIPLATNNIKLLPHISAIIGATFFDQASKEKTEKKVFESLSDDQTSCLKDFKELQNYMKESGRSYDKEKVVEFVNKYYLTIGAFKRIDIDFMRKINETHACLSALTKPD